MNELEDIKLRALLHEIELEKPSSNFTFRVMNQIIEEDNALESIKSERILGKGFWMFLILFIALLATVFIFSSSTVPTESALPEILPQLKNGISEGYQSFFAKLGSAPLSIAGILFASTLLLFIDRLVSSNIKLFTNLDKTA